jgi:hypothetical protein
VARIANQIRPKSSGEAPQEAGSDPDGQFHPPNAHRGSHGQRSLSQAARVSLFYPMPDRILP